MPHRLAAAPFAFVLLMAVACGRTTPTSPTPSPSPMLVNLSGTWILDNPTGVTGQTTTWVLTQAGSSVSGTSSHAAEFVVSDTGTISGDVSGLSFTCRWETITDYGGSGTCHTVRRVSTGTLTVSETSMTGTISSVPQPPCEGRAYIAQYSFRRQ